MIVLRLTAHFVFTSVSFAFLLARGVYGADKSSKHATSSPWFPSGPPPTKLPTETPEELKKVLPLITFDCKGKTGYFPDSQFNCEVFHYCKPDGTRNTFICPSHFIFNQLSMVCEEKTQFNSRICREGSIGPKKERRTEAKKVSKPGSKLSSKKKYKEEISKQLRSRPVDYTKPSSGNAKALEELLRFGHQEAKFYNGDGFNYDGDLVKLPTSSVKSVQVSPTKAAASRAFKTVTEKPKFSKLESISVNKEILQPSESVIDDVSIEYDAIEGRKFRKHKRVGRVLDIEDAPHPPHKGKRQTHSHVSARSPTENPPTDDSTRSPPQSTTTSKSTTLPSLFTADRSKARDFRKRRRNLNRRRKLQKNNDTTTTTEVVEPSEPTTTVPSTQTTKPEPEEPSDRKFDYSRRKSNISRKNAFRKEISHSWLGTSKSGKVEPYTLPPLPIPEEDDLEATTNATEKEEPLALIKKRFPEKGGRTRNPWYKTTPIPIEDLSEIKFGEKISDLYHQHYHVNLKAKSDPTKHKDAEETTHKFITFKDSVHEDYNDSYAVQDERKAKDKYRNGETFLDSDDTAHYPLASHNRNYKATNIEDLFPPPRAEPREHKSLQQQETQQIYSSVEKPGASSEERTTESPYKTTRSYERKYRPKVRAKVGEGQRWRLNKERRKGKGGKIEVGSTFALHTASSESDSQTVLQTPTTTQSPVTNSVFNRKELPKTATLAHQHLLKLMNDFFAMSSSSSKGLMGRASDDFKPIEEDTVTPTFGISDDDMFHGSDSMKEEVEELPAELLDIVDLLADQSEEDRKEHKSDSSHEIIKISGPITNAHLKQILSDGRLDSILRQKKTRKESVKKMFVMPSEDKEGLKEVAEVAKFASLKLEPFLKQMASEKTSMTVIPVTPNPPRRQPSILTAKKIPVHVIYKNQMGGSAAQKKLSKPNVKIVRSQLPRPSLQVIQNGRLSPTRTYSQPHPKPQQFLRSRQPLVLHPKSLYPPHPPPLPKKSLPFKIGFPFAAGHRPMMNLRYISHRRKRSVLSRDRRQLRHNPRFLPFPRPVFPNFNPKFVPTFTPFRSMFPPHGMNSASSNLNPFSFPRFEIQKPPNGVPPAFNQPNSPPGPVRHITQHGHQTIIVEEVPVPIHVEVPDPNFLRPVHSGNQQPNMITPHPGNQHRTPSPPAIQPPPLLQGFQGRFPVTNNYRPFGLPSNVRPPVHYQPSLQFSQPLPPSITDQQGQVFALGVTTQPFAPGKPPPIRVSNGPPGITVKPPLRPFQGFEVHANSYPNFPYFQGAFTTPVTNDPVPGRLMYSGYKPPKSTPGPKLPRTTNHPNRDIKNNAERNNRRPPPRPKPTQAYYVPKPQNQEQRINYKVPNTRERTQYKPEGAHRENYHLNRPRQNVNNGPPAQNEEPVPRRRRPVRKRRPRPHIVTTTPAVHISKDISPTPPPPEQIPPPPADYTSLPLHSEVPNSLQNTKEITKGLETSSHYPPAGYYGKDQLVQFFDSSAKSYNTAPTSKPYEYNDLGESTSSAEVEETVASLSSEDPDQPAFGTRLRSKPRSQNRKRKRQHVQAPTERTEVRVRPNNIPGETEARNRKPSETSNNRPLRNREREENTNNQRRQRVLQHRTRSSPTRRPEMQSFNGPNGFYNVPSGLQDLVAPSQRPPQTNGRSTDMFGIPHPVIDQNIYSLRPQGAPGDFDTSFFSVPSEVAQQQQTSLRNMNIKPIPESAREFFEAAAKESSKIKDDSDSSEKKESEQKPARNATEERKPQRNPAVRKLRKPKRKNRYNPRGNEEKQSPSENADKPQTAQVQRNTLNKERTTTQATTTTEPRPAYIPTENSTVQNDAKEPTVVFKQRAPLLPKALPDFSKSLLNGKLDIKKLNATISTSVSVSGAFPRQSNNNTSSEDNSSKRVFSSQNGGLSVVRSNPRKKKPKQRQSSHTNSAFNVSEDTKAKYDIAASVLDIIKATTETEKQGTGFYSTRYDNGEKSSAKSSNS